MRTITIRAEAAADEQGIFRLTQKAFRTMPFSEGDEQELIDQLRVDGDLALSLIAECDGRIVGHIALSRVSISDGSENWYGLGPVSVLPEMQRQGIGSRLTEHGIAELRQRGAKGIVLLGNPEYYARFGFEHDRQLRYPGPPPEYFQRLVIAGAAPRGTVAYAPAFRQDRQE